MVLTEEVALGVLSVLLVWLVVVARMEVVEAPLTSWPTPQGIAWPSGWVLCAGGTILLDLSVIVNRPVQTLLLAAGELNW